jgi:DNA replication protein DnaC
LNPGPPAWNWRENQALARRLKSAKLRHNACIEDIDYRAARGLEKTVIRGLAKDSQWVQNHENLFVLGPTGVGKSYIACAVAQAILRRRYAGLSKYGSRRRRTLRRREQSPNPHSQTGV